MPTIGRLTDKFLRTVRTGKGSEEFWDESRPGFLVRVLESGTRTFLFSYREPGARPARERPKRLLRLGVYNPEDSDPSRRFTLADAVSAWKGASGQVSQGVNPKGPGVAPQTTDKPGLSSLLDGIPGEHSAKLRDLFGDRDLIAGSFGELARDYLVVHAWVEKRRSGEDERMLKRELLPLWRDVPAAAVQPEDVATLVRNIVVLRKAPVAANHVRLLVSRIYSFGISQVRARFNPAHGVRVPGGKARTGSRWLSDEEIIRLWWGLDAQWSPESKNPRNANRRLTSGDVFRALTRCRIVLFQRPGEVAYMEWSEIQPDGWWVIPGTKFISLAGRKTEVGTKNKLPHAVYLPPLALEQIESLRELSGHGRFVFPSPKRPDQPIACTNKTLAALQARLKIPHFTPHDLRRTGTTNLQRLQVDDTLIDRLVNHQPRGVQRSYNLWAFQEERKAAMCLWDTHLRSILGIEGDRGFDPGRDRLGPPQGFTVVDRASRETAAFDGLSDP